MIFRSRLCEGTREITSAVEWFYSSEQHFLATTTATTTIPCLLFCLFLLSFFDNLNRSHSFSLFLLSFSSWLIDVISVSLSLSSLLRHVVAWVCWRGCSLQRCGFSCRVQRYPFVIYLSIYLFLEQNDLFLVKVLQMNPGSLLFLRRTWRLWQSRVNLSPLHHHWRLSLFLFIDSLGFDF